VPHVDASSIAGRDDLLLSARDRQTLLTSEVVVEEKLDGMNVCLWVDSGVVHVGTRGGEFSVDRSGERGRILAWARIRSDALRVVLGEQLALYGEWLRRRHVVQYDRLPAELIGLDVLDRHSGVFATLDERNAHLTELEIPQPPCLFRGVLRRLDFLTGLQGQAAFGRGAAEGLVVRPIGGGPPRLAKYVGPEWESIGSRPWQGENVLASGV
jgi:hypothetical protein